MTRYINDYFFLVFDRLRSYHQKLVDLIKPSGYGQQKDMQLGGVLVCFYTYFVQAVYCASLGLFVEPLVCTIATLVFLGLILAFKMNYLTDEWLFNIFCFFVPTALVLMILLNGMEVNATYIFLACSPLVSFIMVGMKKAVLWTFYMIFLSIFLFYLAPYYDFSIQRRTDEQEFQLIISNAFFAPLLVAALMSYTFYKINTAQEELMLTVNRLKEVTKDKERLLSVLFHDLGRNASLLSGYLEASENQALNDKAKNKVLSLTEEIKDILVNAKELDTQNFSTNSDSVHFYEVFTSLKHNFLHLLEQKNLQFIFKGGKEIVFSGNLSQFKNQILGNILSNAIKFSDRGGVVSFHVCDKAITISNDGLEFTPDLKEGTLGELGTGVGLEIVRDFCAKNNYLFEISSQNGRTDARVFLRR